MSTRPPSLDREGVAYVNGRIFTINTAQPWASAFIVSPNGRFAQVGETLDILAIAKEHQMIVYDLRDRFVMPGIHDAHTHLLSASMQKLNESAIGFDSNEKTIAEKLKHGACACAYAHVWGDWVIGNFYSSEEFPDGRPDRKYLDEAFPDTPVIVRDRTCHNVLVNTAALKRAGYDPSDIDPAGGSYVRRADGQMTGELLEVASRKAWLSLPTPALAHVKRALRYGIQMSHRFGITSCQEASANTIYMTALQELEKEGLLNIDMHPHIVFAPENFALESLPSLAACLDRSESFNSEHVNARFLKIWMDGAPLPPHFTQCDLNENDHPDESKLLVDWETLLGAVTKYDDRGITCKIHCAGEGSIRRALDVIQAVRVKSDNGPRHELAHCNAIHPSDIPRLAKLRVTAEMSPAMFHEADLIAAFPDIFKWAFADILGSGGKITFGSDWFLPETPSLFPSLAAVVEKLGDTCKDEEGKTMTLRQKGGELICRMITLGGAEAVGTEKVTGSIEPGKKAHFITLDKDLSQGEFDDVRVLKTWFEGKMVWNSDEQGAMALCT